MCCRQTKKRAESRCLLQTRGGVHRGRVGTKTGLERSFSLYLVCSMARSATRGTRGLADDSNVQIVYLGTNSSTVGRKRARHHQTGEPKSTDTELDCSSMPKIVICIRAIHTGIRRAPVQMNSPANGGSGFIPQTCGSVVDPGGGK